MNVLDRLRKEVARTRYGMSATWQLHHENAPCHNVVQVRSQTPGAKVAPADFFLTLRNNTA